MEGFHTHNGWSWQRKPDGSVLVTVGGGHHQHLMTPEEWASVVATLSAAGETAERYQDALKFHQGV